MKKYLLTAALLASVAAPAAQAQFSANIGAVTDYRFRGISQTNKKPALQGGLDYAFSNGLYVGTWASTVTKDLYPHGAGLEVDLYGGWKKEIAKDLTLDLASSTTGIRARLTTPLPLAALPITPSQPTSSTTPSCTSAHLTSGSRPSISTPPRITSVPARRRLTARSAALMPTTPRPVPPAARPPAARPKGRAILTCRPTMNLHPSGL